MVRYVAGSAMPECNVFSTEILIFTCCFCLQSVLFLICHMKATSFHWETDTTGAGGVTGVKAIFSPFFVDSNCKSFPLRKITKFGFPVLLGNVLYPLKIGTFKWQLARTEKAFVNAPFCIFPRNRSRR